MISTVVFLFSLAKCEIFNAYEYENANISWHFHIYQQKKKSCSAGLSTKKSFITSEPGILYLHSISRGIPFTALAKFVPVHSLADLFCLSFGC